MADLYLYAVAVVIEFGGKQGDIESPWSHAPQESVSLDQRVISEDLETVIVCRNIRYP